MDYEGLDLAYVLIYSWINNLLTSWEVMATQIWTLFRGRRPLCMCVCMWLYFFGSCNLLQILPSLLLLFVLHEVNYVVPWQAPLSSASTYGDPEAMEPRDNPLVKRNLSSELLVLNWVNAWKMLGINTGRC